MQFAAVFDMSKKGKSRIPNHGRVNHFTLILNRLLSLTPLRKFGQVPSGGSQTKRSIPIILKDDPCRNPNTNPMSNVCAWVVNVPEVGFASNMASRWSATDEFRKPRSQTRVDSIGRYEGKDDNILIRCVNLSVLQDR